MKEDETVGDDVVGDDVVRGGQVIMGQVEAWDAKESRCRENSLGRMRFP